ncbi:MAG: hypothetical protein KBD78_15980 [Oligoflexales bacterium]|nr:hypothetical protein [Oligoflexales bacterium]
MSVNTSLKFLLFAVQIILNIACSSTQKVASQVKNVTQTPIISAAGELLPNSEPKLPFKFMLISGDIGLLFLDTDSLEKDEIDFLNSVAIGNTINLQGRVETRRIDDIQFRVLKVTKARALNLVSLFGTLEMVNGSAKLVGGGKTTEILGLPNDLDLGKLLTKKVVAEGVFDATGNFKVDKVTSQTDVCLNFENSENYQGTIANFEKLALIPEVWPGYHLLKMKRKPVILTDSNTAFACSTMIYLGKKYGPFLHNESLDVRNNANGFWVGLNIDSNLDKSIVDAYDRLEPNFRLQDDMIFNVAAQQDLPLAVHEGFHVFLQPEWRTDSGTSFDREDYRHKCIESKAINKIWQVEYAQLMHAMRFSMDGKVTQALKSAHQFIETRKQRYKRIKHVKIDDGGGEEVSCNEAENIGERSEGTALFVESATNIAMQINTTKEVQDYYSGLTNEPVDHFYHTGAAQIFIMQALGGNRFVKLVETLEKQEREIGVFEVFEEMLGN